MKKHVPRHRTLFIISLLICTTIIVYWKVQHHGFVNYDDGKYITANAHVQEGLSWNSLCWAFTTTHANFWHPLTWLSHMLDSELYGLNAGGHHLTNVLLHVANTILLFLVLLRTTDAPWKSGFAAALFAVHPLHVESVAWASERKDVLSTLFWLLTIWAYVSYVRKPHFARYLLILFYFCLGMMAKPMLVTLPFVLLLLDYWPLGRFGAPSQGLEPAQSNQGSNTRRVFRLGIRFLFEKIPLLVPAAAASVIAFVAQETGGATKSLALFPAGVRLANALISYVTYLEKTFWPTDLTVFYPHSGLSIDLSQATLAGALLVILTLAFINAAKLHPYLLVGWLWYLGTLIPVIGLVQVGDHGMADRYTYVPLIGVFIAISWGVPAMLKGWRHDKVAFAAAVPAALAVLMTCSWYQVGHWQNSVTLFEHALRTGQVSPLAHTDLGVALVEQGNVDRAIRHYRQALQINPAYLVARLNLGGALAGQGKLDEAIAHYAEALKQSPNLAVAHFNMANALATEGRLDRAVSHYREAIRIEPDDPDTHNNLGIALARLARTEEASLHFRMALRINPDFEKAKHNLEVTLQQTPHGDMSPQKKNDEPSVPSF